MRKTFKNTYVCVITVISLVFLVTCLALFVLTGKTSPTITNHTFANNYTITEIHNLLSPNECKLLQTIATEKGLQDSNVWGADSNVLQYNHRKSKQSWLKDEEHSLVAKISQTAAQLTGMPLNHQEDLQVARYQESGMFNAHYDACENPTFESCKLMNNGGGQRLFTLLIYLNDDFQGGETHFPKIGYTIKPKKGSAILFRNVDDNDYIIEEAFHQGNPVKGGHKWIATKWVHSTKYNK